MSDMHKFRLSGNCCGSVPRQLKYPGTIYAFRLSKAAPSISNYNLPKKRSPSIIGRKAWCKFLYDGAYEVTMFSGA